MSNFIFSNEQKSIFEYDKNDVIQVNGSPGSGKTLVAIKKAILLAKKYDKKVLFLYYNKSLGYEIRRLFGTFDEYSLLKNKIVIDHIDNYIKICLTSPALKEKLKEIKGRKNKYPKSKFDRESRMSLAIDEYKKHNKSSSFYRMDRDFLLSEIDWLRNCDFTKEEYLKNKRLERGSLKKIDLKQKQEVLDILGYYRKVENEEEYFQDYHDYMISALYYLRRKDLFLDEQNYFDHIIIDEAQDFSKLHLEFIKLISNIDNNTESSITFFMDINQTINIEKAWCLNNERNLEDANFEIKEENVLYLNRCYRNVEEIYSAAEKLLDNNCYKSSNISIDERGIKPLRLKSRTLEEEINNVITIIDILINKYQYEYSDFTIISQFTTNLEEKLKNKFPITTKNENSNSINLTTFYSAKGIESKVVFILGLNDEYFPSKKIFPLKSNDEIIEEGKKLLFVAMTRATELLFLSSLQKESPIFSLFDENDFINLDFENNNFDIIFGRELSTNKNITTENESKRYDIIKEIKEFEKRIISEIQSLRKETSLKFEDLKKSEAVKKESKNIEDEKDKEEPKIIEKEVIKEVEKIIKVEVPVEKIIEKEKIVEVKVEVEKEVNKIEKLINPEKIEEEIRKSFPLASETTQNELIGAEINYNINYINKDNQALLKRMNLKYNTVAYIIALETELRDYYSKMCSAKIISEKFNDSITLGGLILKLKENPVFKIPVDDFYKKDLLNLRNESLHVHADNAKFIDFEQLKEVRKTIMNDLLKRFILGFHSLKIKNKDNTDLKKSVINAKMVTRGESYDSSIKKYKNFKGFYSCILEDINGKQYGAVTKFTYELEKFYKFICEDCYIDGTTVKNIIGREK
ncbi:AAA family ATPase [Fusobacterium periodonticum]|uniref:3'-5' exonuclease n=1 Tax=Fusobacterium periodonticum TaxID=860 RepID=UPI00195E9EB0|nr:3'-5' exonuclease [Fusobacterium periodonticum]VTX57808.1 ATP-dependent DNA helicase PcrA [Fusobacterium periodonticum]